MRLFAFILTSILITSCCRYSRCVERFGATTDMIRVPYERIVPVEVIVPSDSTQIALAVDSILKMREGVVYRSTDTISRIQMSYMRRGATLLVKAVTDTLILRDTVVVKDTITIPPHTVFVKPPSLIKRALLRYTAFAGIALPFVTLLLYLLFKRR